jgi:hypothetical protein
MDLGLSGLASGFDWKSLVNQLSDVERAPQKRLRSDQSLIQNRNQAYGSVKTQLNVLKNRLDNLSSDSVLQARKASVSDTSILTATAASGVSTGTYELNITQLATASKTLGTSGVGGNLYPTNTVDSGSLSTKGFSPAISAGTITVDGHQITVDPAVDTLQDVFTRINTATGGNIQGSYDSSTDKVSLTRIGHRQRYRFLQFPHSGPVVQQRDRFHRERLQPRQHQNQQHAQPSQLLDGRQRWRGGRRCDEDQRCLNQLQCIERLGANLDGPNQCLRSRSGHQL